MRWALFDAQGVAEEPDENSNGKHDDRVNNRQQDSGLKVADSVRES